MATVRPMVTSLAEYTAEDLEALERERPELGRVEIVDGALHATGESAFGVRHQLLVQRLHLLMAPLCPAGLIVMIDAWWHYARGKIRADIGVYRVNDIPEHGEVFRLPPVVSLEVLSDDATHDLVAKDRVYAEHGSRRGYIDRHERDGWWCRLDGVDYDTPQVTWQQLDDWPPLVFDKAVLLNPRAG